MKSNSELLSGILNKARELTDAEHVSMVEIDPHELSVRLELRPYYVTLEIYGSLEEAYGRLNDAGHFDGLKRKAEEFIANCEGVSNG